MVVAKAKSMDLEMNAHQSNHEGSMIDKIHEWADSGFGINQPRWLYPRVLP